MSTLAPDARKIKIDSTDRTFTLFQALAIILVSVTVFLASGLLLGKVFFWKTIEDTRVEQQFAYFKSKVDAEPKVAENRVNLGYTYYLKGEYDKALQQFQVALSIDPKFADANYNAGLVYKEQKRYDEALEVFAKAAKLAPRDYKHYLMMGVIYNEQGNHKSAITALNRANAEKPGSSDVIYQIGMAAEKTGDKEGARQLYQTALNYDPNYKEAKEALARLK